MFPEMKKELQPFCYEHLAEMMPYGDSLNAEAALRYVCSVSDCLINYNTSSGYHHQHAGDQSTAPSVRCPNDGMPMYLAEIHPEYKNYRLWKCPQCGKSLTNLESTQARG